MAAWYEVCEWNEQDARRTLEHANDLLALWCSGIDVEHDDHVRGAVAQAIDISERWRTTEDRATLAISLWRTLTAINEQRADTPNCHTGTVVQLNSSLGGVPKTAIPSASVGWRGVEGDVQQTRRHHGRPWQALCLWSADVIEAFAADGHPVVAGGAGENLTVRGIDWSSLRAGTVIDVGAVRCQLTAPAVPCSKVAASFLGRDISLIDHDLHPGTSRWYAAVLRPGQITADDSVTINPRIG